MLRRAGVGSNPSWKPREGQLGGEEQRFSREEELRYDHEVLWTRSRLHERLRPFEILKGAMVSMLAPAPHMLARKQRTEHPSDLQERQTSCPPRSRTLALHYKLLSSVSSSCCMTCSFIHRRVRHTAEPAGQYPTSRVQRSPCSPPPATHGHCSSLPCHPASLSRPLLILLLLLPARSWPAIAPARPNPLPPLPSYHPSSSTTPLYPSKTTRIIIR